MKHADLHTVFVYGQCFSLVLFSCYNGLTMTMVSAGVVFRFLPVVFRIDAHDSGWNELWFNILAPEKYGCYCALFDVILFKMFDPCRFCTGLESYVAAFFLFKIIHLSVPLTTDLWDVSVLITVILLVAWCKFWTSSVVIVEPIQLCCKKQITKSFYCLIICISCNFFSSLNTINCCAIFILSGLHERKCFCALFNILVWV